MHFDSTRALKRKDYVLRELLDGWAEATPQAPFAIFGDASFTYAEFRLEVRRTARALQDIGIEQGDHVFVWLPNGLEIVKVWFALNYIGAVYVPINTAYKGRLLEHVLKNSDASVAIVHADLVERLDTIDRAALQTIVVVGKTQRSISGIRMLREEALQSNDDVRPLERQIEPWDTQSIIYTSGTTGASKGVLSSYAHLYFMGLGVVSNQSNIPFLRAADRFLVTSPLFHVGGTSPIYGMLAVGGSIAIIDAFDTASFWRRVDETGATCVVLLGVMASFLVKQPASAADRKSSLKHAIIVPLTAEGVIFGERFAVTTHTLFSMTEISVPIISEDNPKRVGSCGRAREGVDLRIVDANDCEVPDGTVGELVLRTSRPWLLNHGYSKDPAATAQAWRNGWFHSGDGFRKEPDGSFFFVDRFKDAIRRRGENISSFEVEAEVSAHPAIREVAAVAVPSEHSEDEILIAVAASNSATIDPVELTEFLKSRMAYFMVPRYIRVMDELPKTPTRKIEKYLIRNAGVTPDTWDREKAGIRLRREQLATKS